MKEDKIISEYGRLMIEYDGLRVKNLALNDRLHVVLSKLKSLAEDEWTNREDIESLITWLEGVMK
jgi:hypothetical protein